MKGVISSILLFCFFSNNGQAPLDTVDLFNMSIEELMNVKVTVAGKTESEIKNTPGIITVISSEDIKNNQCRDLVDVFNMVPGFAIAKDDDFISFTSRGLYGFEGRALFQLDGNQLTDLYFGSFVLGNELPVHMIDKIEIIRGPGSVIYGGTAELTVINIITKKGAKIDGVNIAARHGQLGTKAGHSDVAINAGKQIGEFEVSLLAFHSEALRSGGSGSFLYGGNAVYEHTKKSAGTTNSLISINSTYKEKTNLQVSYNTSRFNELFAFSLDPENPNPDENIYSTMDEVYASDRVNYNKFHNLSSSLSHKIKHGDFTIVPSLQHQYSSPFIKPGKKENIAINRIKPSVLGIYKFNIGEVFLGGEFYNDHSQILRHEGEPKQSFLRTSINEVGQNAVNIYNYAAYSNIQVHFFKNKTIKGSINGGLRLDKNELFDTQLSPRVGLNFNGNKFYTKLLFSRAFRAPLSANNVHSKYGLNPNSFAYSRPKQGVGPEHLTAFEVEGSYSFTKRLALTVNLYYQYIDDIIEFRFNPENGDLYSDNGGKLGTKGLESELKYQTKKWNIKLNYSLLSPVFFTHKNPYASAYNTPLGGETYITPDADLGFSSKNELMAVPYYKVFASTTYSLSKTVKVNINGLYLSKIWTDNGDFTSSQKGNQLILGTNISYQKERITAAFSIHDLLNSYQVIGTPWYGAPHDTLSYKGREISLSVIYSLF